MRRQSSTCDRAHSSGWGHVGVANISHLITDERHGLSWPHLTLYGVADIVGLSTEGPRGKRTESDRIERNQHDGPIIEATWVMGMIMSHTQLVPFNQPALVYTMNVEADVDRNSIK